jgi:hypothetical protein
VSLVRGDGTIEVRDPKLIRIGEMLPSDEIDMSSDAALLEAAYAQHTLDEARAPNETPAGEQPETVKPAGIEHPAKDEPGVVTGTESAGAPHGGSVDSVGRVELKANRWQGRILRPQSCAFVAPRQRQRRPRGAIHRCGST